MNLQRFHVGRFRTACLLLVVLGLVSGRLSISAQTINANATANNGGSPNWGIFFDLTTASNPISLFEMTTASTAAANAGFSLQVYIRSGTSLGGPVSGGPGSSMAGWTLLGTASATQGPVASGISLPIALPAINVDPFSTVGVALVFSGAGPRYANATAYQMFSDPNLTLTTGDARSVPFTPTGSWFAPRGLTGSITYAVVPEPSSIAFLAAGASMSLLALRCRNRR